MTSNHIFFKYIHPSFIRSSNHISFIKWWNHNLNSTTFQLTLLYYARWASNKTGISYTVALSRRWSPTPLSDHHHPSPRISTKNTMTTPKTKRRGRLLRRLSPFFKPSASPSQGTADQSNNSTGPEDRINDSLPDPDPRLSSHSDVPATSDVPSIPDTLEESMYVSKSARKPLGAD